MKKLTLNEFIDKSNKIHKHRYDYSKSIYINSRTKLCIICPDHGEFWQIPNSHLSGKGCPICCKQKIAEYVTTKKKQSCETFVQRAVKTHNSKYDYSKANYVDFETKVCIICPEHGEFLMSPHNHLRGHGCPMCKKDKLSILWRKTKEEFVRESNAIHKNLYDYSKFNYIGKEKQGIIICPIHGEFLQTPSVHLRGCGCQKCNSSHLEKEIRELLMEKGLNFIEQCNGRYLPWIGRLSIDFYIPDYKVGIGCQGLQHFF